jgi:hypothetical protein
MTITADELAGRIDVTLAVEQILTPAERGAFRRHVLVGPFQGADPSDWIDEAMNADAMLDRIEPWWAEHGDATAQALAQRYRLPRTLASGLLSAALYAAFAIASADLGERRRGPAEIAAEAAAWTLGFAFRLGWIPPSDIEAAGDPVGAPDGSGDRAQAAAEELPTVGQWPGDGQAAP